ncbi:MAG TPA: exodeoxyribonuclease V subunit alpha [Marmoricola sp.]|nr:exodeoxyribonuclease V subunit alpha [Marmoricola sp.]
MTVLETGDRRLALGATGLLRTFNEAGVLATADVHVASRLGALLGEADEQVLLAAAVAVRAVRQGSVCVDLGVVAGTVERGVDEEPLPWPDPEAWRAAVAASPLVAEQVLRLDGAELYLDRYWREEQQVCDALMERRRRRAPEVDEPLLAAGVDRVFGGHTEQRDAVLAAARQWTTVLTGGPGTGKTTTVAGLLALLSEQHARSVAESGSRRGAAPRIALCAPTGKAAARLQEAVESAAAVLAEEGRLTEADSARLRGLEAVTMHRLLGWRPDSSVRFRHDRTNRLPHDVIVVDETSMVSLTMMARLLEAVRPQTRLVLVGDADQLSSVEAGAVLADLVDGLGAAGDSSVVTLRTNHRYGGAIGALAEALRRADSDEVMRVLRSGEEGVELIDPTDVATLTGFREDVAGFAHRIRLAAEEGDAVTALDELGQHRLLCAHREGPFGVGGWNRLVEQIVSERTGVTHYDEWYAGRPVLVTANDSGQRLSNGDMGVAVRREDGRLRVVLAGMEDREFAPTRLPDVQTMHALTVHKSQGSQAPVVSVVLPDEESRLLTRELLYTAVTRAQSLVRVVGTEAAIRSAVEHEVQRASGLRGRLRSALDRSAEAVE